MNARINIERKRKAQRRMRDYRNNRLHPLIYAMAEVVVRASEASIAMRSIKLDFPTGGFIAPVNEGGEVILSEAAIAKLRTRPTFPTDGEIAVD